MEAIKVKLSNGHDTLIDWEDRGLMDWFTWHAARDHGNIYVRAGTKKAGLNTLINLHRLIMCAGNGMQVDHINGNGLDNRKCNLRICTHAQNQRNQSVRQGNYSSKYKGVHYCKTEKVWRAAIRVNGVRIHLGQYKTELEAARVYDKAAITHHKEFARINGV